MTAEPTLARHIAGGGNSAEGRRCSKSGLQPSARQPLASIQPLLPVADVLRSPARRRGQLAAALASAQVDVKPVQIMCCMVVCPRRMFLPCCSIASRHTVMRRVASDLRCQLMQRVVGSAGHGQPAGRLTTCEQPQPAPAAHEPGERFHASARPAGHTGPVLAGRQSAVSAGSPAAPSEPGSRRRRGPAWRHQPSHTAASGGAVTESAAALRHSAARLHAAKAGARLTASGRVAFCDAQRPEHASCSRVAACRPAAWRGCAGECCGPCSTSQCKPSLPAAVQRAVSTTGCQSCSWCGCW